MSMSLVRAMPGGTVRFGRRWEELEGGARAQPMAGVQTGREEEALSKAPSTGVEGRVPVWKEGRVPAAPRCAHPCRVDEGRGEAWEAGEVTLSSGTGMGAYKYQAE